MKKKKIGLIVNPVAGMGGSVGLKGTDGRKMYELPEVRRGSDPAAGLPDRRKQNSHRSLSHHRRVDQRSPGHARASVESLTTAYLEKESYYHGCKTCL